MLTRLKELVSGKELKEIAEQLNKAAAAVKEQTELIAGLKKESEDAKKSATEMTGEIRESIAAARQLQEELAKTLSELKALSTHVQSSIKQKITDELFELTKEVKAKLEGTEKLKNEVATAATSVSGELNKLKSEIAKLSYVAERIRAEDFELTRFGNQLAAADSEKLRLMGRIDALERLIAKMRRQQ
ncbi:hypothetical protein HYV83_03505 [Candidatus Woesearchaeota archaeon]|nr:hypothetical protein [Candidatus Woesearchaeota archaeon]